MRVFLGDMELRTSEKPDFIQRGGGQHLAVKEFPGGNVSVQNFGSRYRKVSWNGWFEGVDAYERMIRIGNMRQKCLPVALITERTNALYVIEEYYPDYKSDRYIPFSITLQPIIGPPKKVENTDIVDKVSEKIAIENAEQSKEKKPDPIIHVVVQGDTLSKIALKHLGNANLYDGIYNDNRDTLTKGPHLIYPGQKLVINKP